MYAYVFGLGGTKMYAYAFVKCSVTVYKMYAYVSQKISRFYLLYLLWGNSMHTSIIWCIICFYHVAHCSDSKKKSKF